MQVFLTVNNVGIKINADVNVKNWLSKENVIKDLFGIPVIVNVNVIKIAGIALIERRNDCKSSCTIYVVLFGIVFAINLGIDTYFIYYNYMNHDKNLLLKTTISIKHQIINVNGKYQRNKH